MNAAVAKSISRTASFLWLLKREFWEHRGGFVWAQLITGGIAVFFAALALLLGTVNVRSNSEGGHIPYVGDHHQLNHTLGKIGDSLLLSGQMLAAVVLAFVVFFYALGSLYDDRRDRSLLFWKSLPLSDTQTVLSKVAWALLLAPLVSIVTGLIVGLALWLLGVAGAFLGGAPDPWAVVLEAHPFRLLMVMLLTVPIGLLWSLPTVGWLMFCSAWANSKPFLWAVLLPLLSCVMISIVAAMPGISLPTGWIWYALAYRGLLSTVPGSWAPVTVDHSLAAEIGRPANDIAQWLLLHNDPVRVYGNTDIWIGAVVGIALIVAAIHRRRRSGEA